MWKFSLDPHNDIQNCLWYLQQDPRLPQVMIQKCAFNDRYHLWWMLNTIQLQMSEQRGPSLLCQDYQEWKIHWIYHMSEERVWIFNISFWWRCGHCGLEIYICIEFISSLNSRRDGWREQVAGEGPRVGAGPGGCGWWQHKYWVVRPIGSRAELMINFCVYIYYSISH